MYYIPSFICEHFSPPLLPRKSEMLNLQQVEQSPPAQVGSTKQRGQLNILSARSWGQVQCQQELCQKSSYLCIIYTARLNGLCLGCLLLQHRTACPSKGMWQLRIYLHSNDNIIMSLDKRHLQWSQLPKTVYLQDAHSRFLQSLEADCNKIVPSIYISLEIAQQLDQLST